MTVKMIAPIKATDAQNEWLAKEKKRTGNTIAAIIRNLIQDRIEQES